MKILFFLETSVELAQLRNNPLFYTPVDREAIDKRQITRHNSIQIHLFALIEKSKTDIQPA